MMCVTLRRGPIPWSKLSFVPRRMLRPLSTSGVLRSEIAEVRSYFDGQVEALKEVAQALKQEIQVCKAAVAGGATMREGPKVKVPEKDQGSQGANAPLEC